MPACVDQRHFGNREPKPTDQMNAPTDSAATPARLYALIAGAGMTLGGIGGFFYDASFGTGTELASDEILSLFPTNGWENILHLILGLAGLALASRSPRAYSLGAGALLTVFALWSAAVTDRGNGSLLDVIPVGGKLNALHLLLGLAGIAAGIAQERRSRNSSASPRKPS